MAINVGSDVPNIEVAATPDTPRYVIRQWPMECPICHIHCQHWIMVHYTARIEGQYAYCLPCGHLTSTSYRNNTPTPPHIHAAALLLAGDM